MAIICTVRKLDRIIHPNSLNFTNNRNIKKHIVVAKKSGMLIISFLIGWLPAIITCIYKLKTGNMLMSMDIIVGISNSINSVLIGLIYGMNNHESKIWVMTKCCMKSRADRYRQIMKTEQSLNRSNSVKTLTTPQTSIILVKPLTHIV